MFAIIRRNSYDLRKAADVDRAIGAFQALHAEQRGYSGSIIVDTGNGQRITVNLWESEQASEGGRMALVPHLKRLLEPLMAGPSEFLGAGEVVQRDLSGD